MPRVGLEIKGLVEPGFIGPRINIRSLSVARLGLSIDSGVHAHQRGPVRADIILVSSKCASLRRDALELLLGWSVRVADRQRKRLLTEPGASEPLDDLVTYLAALEAVCLSEFSTMR